MATTAKVRDRAAEMLGLIPVGQALRDQDRTRVEAFYAEVYDDLLTHGLATWTVAGTVPDEVVPHVAALMAMHGTEIYGVSPARYQRIAVKAAAARPELRRLTRPRYEGLTEPTDY